MRGTIHRGDDPRRAAQPETTTLATALEAAALLKAPTWRGGRGGDSARKWQQISDVYILPNLGGKPVATLTASDVLRVVADVWTDKRPTGRRILTQLRAATGWAIAEGLRSDDPTEAARRALPANGHRAEHHDAPEPAAVAAAIAAVAASPRTWWSIPAALRFVALTACRSGEARGARWSEIDLTTATWTVPGERAKTGAALRVALSRQALAVLADAAERAGGEPEAGALVFPAERSAGPLGRDALTAALRRTGTTWDGPRFAVEFPGRGPPRLAWSRERSPRRLWGMSSAASRVRTCVRTCWSGGARLWRNDWADVILPF